MGRAHTGNMPLRRWLVAMGGAVIVASISAVPTHGQAQNGATSSAAGKGSAAPKSVNTGRRDVIQWTTSGSGGSRINGLVLEGVTVVDVEQGKLLPSQRVVIVGNRIQAVGVPRYVKAPQGARVVNARGKYLIPGLWDMHTHSTTSSHISYPLFLANGVTGIRDAGSSVPLSTLRQWRQAFLEGTWAGPPRQILSGPMLDGVLGKKPRCLGGHVCATDSAHARRLVDSLWVAGVDMIKTYGLSREMYFVVAAEARRLGVSFGGHVGSVTPIEASDSGALILDHSLGAEMIRSCQGIPPRIELCRLAADQLRRHGTWLVPTLTVVPLVADMRESSYNAGIHRRLREQTKAFWAGAMAHGNWLRESAAGEATTASYDSSSILLGQLAVMQQVGLPILAGSDVHPTRLQVALAGLALHAELALYVAGGLTPLNALQSATLNPARAIGATDSLGTVAAGKLADLVLLDADPLADITNTTQIRAVMANGRYYDRAALDQLLIDARVQGNAEEEP